MDILLRSLPYLLKGALITVQLSLICLVAGTFLGGVLGTLSAFGPSWVRIPIGIYVFLIRGIPVLILMFLAYFGLPSIGIEIDSVVAVSASMSLYSAAHVTEIVRGSLLGVDKGQILAGKSIGLRWWQVLAYIQLPIAGRMSIGPMINNSIIMVKTTSYASIVGVWELTFAGREIVERTLSPFAIFLGILMIYFSICYPLGILSRVLERRYSYAH